MGLTELLLGVVFVTGLGFGIGLGAMGDAGNVEFWVARAGFVIAGLAAAGSFWHWWNEGERQLWHTIILGTVAGLWVFVGLPLQLRWLETRETKIKALEAATHQAKKEPAQAKQEPPKSSSPPATPDTPRFPTIAELFKTDFPQFFKISSEMTTKVGIAPPVKFTAQVYKDLETQSMFLGIYIPASPFTVSACLGIAHDYEKILKEAENAVIIYTRPGEHVPNTSKDLKFSGRVYIYHEQELSVREIADLVDIFKSRSLSVQFRGMSYASEVFRDRLLREKK
jgi:hypothetical protein